MTGKLPDFSIFEKEFPQIAKNGKYAVKDIAEDEYFSTKTRLIIEEIVVTVLKEDKFEPKDMTFKKKVDLACDKKLLQEKWKKILPGYYHQLSEDLHINFFSRMFNPKKPSKIIIINDVYELCLEYAKKYGKLDYNRPIMAESVVNNPELEKKAIFNNIDYDGPVIADTVENKPDYIYTDESNKMSLFEQLGKILPVKSKKKPAKKKVVVRRKSVSKKEVAGTVVPEERPADELCICQIPAFSAMQKLQDGLLGLLGRKMNFLYALNNDSVLEDLEKSMVKIPGCQFEMMESVVTRKLYESIMNNKICAAGQALYPMTSISWDDAVKFCTRLNELESEFISGQERGKYRLPTVEEWTIASRCGKDYAYSGSNNLDEVGWFKYNSGWQVHEVKRKKPNETGLYDMSGNVWEWTSSESDDPGMVYVCGGSCKDNVDNCRIDNPYLQSKKAKLYNYGFRIVRDISPLEKKQI